MRKSSVFLGALAWFLAQPVLAQPGEDVPVVATTAGALYMSICNVANWFFAFVLVGAVIAVIYSGFLFMTSQGNPPKIVLAKTVLKYALFGAAVVIMSKSIILIIGSLLGFSTIDAFLCS